MRDRVLDTNRLIARWRRRQADAGGLDRVDRPQVVAWAGELCRLRQNRLIVTPVRIEMLAGTRSARETDLTAAYLTYLDVFECADGGDVRAEDWRLAERMARRVPPDGRPRQLGDCLIAALCERLRRDLDSADSGMPRHLY